MKYDGVQLTFMNLVQGKEFKIVVFVKPSEFEIIKLQPGKSAFMSKSTYCEMEISWGLVLEENSQIIPIRNGSVVTWHHVNLQGEYNFSDEYLESAFEFGIDRIP